MNYTRIKSRIQNKLNKSELSKRLFKGISWSLIGSFGGKLFQLLAFIVVARVIGKEDYGRVGIIRSTIAMFMIFSTFGMSTTATRYISLYRNIFPQKALEIYKFANKTTLLFGSLFAVIVLLLSNSLANFTLYDASLTTALRIAAVTLLFLSLTATQTGVLNGFEDFKSLGVNSVINGLFQLTLIISGAYIWGINGAIAGLSLSAVLYWVQLKVAIRPNIARLNETIKNSKDKVNLFSVFLKFSLPSLLASITVFPVLWWTKTELIQHSGYEEMAVFDVAEQWYFTLLFIPNSLSSIILPLLTNTSVEGTSNQYRKLIKINLLINVLITFSLAIVIGLFSPFINSLYGKEFTNYFPMLIMLATAVICSANNVLGQVIASKGKMWIGFGLNSLWALWLVLFTLHFVGKMHLGALGLAYAMILSYFLHSITQVIVAFRMKYFEQ